jgi:hypothetical protein
MRDHLAHPYFDTDHVVLQATVDNDLPELERAVQALAETMPAEDQQEEGPPEQASTPASLVGRRAYRMIVRCGGGAAAEQAFVEPQAGEAGDHADHRYRYQYQYQILPLKRAQRPSAARWTIRWPGQRWWIAPGPDRRIPGMSGSRCG